ncbi:hypothetical protein B0H10DRAFT_1959894 [Mycena sp. CBHHK59/15]|nr:hypothetical protein B0H10DRAFT_1959894 [Mycena sp. CBHHK59/15]
MSDIELCKEMKRGFALAHQLSGSGQGQPTIPDSIQLRWISDHNAQSRENIVMVRMVWVAEAVQPRAGVHRGGGRVRPGKEFKIEAPKSADKRADSNGPTINRMEL